MTLVVKKFGGSSVGSLDKIRYVASTIASDYNDGVKVVTVVSAMGDETDRLVRLVNDLDEDYHGRELDAVLATGEQVCAGLLAIAST